MVGAEAANPTGSVSFSSRGEITNVGIKAQIAVLEPAVVASTTTFHSFLYSTCIGVCVCVCLCCSTSLFSVCLSSCSPLSAARLLRTLNRRERMRVAPPYLSTRRGVGHTVRTRKGRARSRGGQRPCSGGSAVRRFGAVAIVWCPKHGPNQFHHSPETLHWLRTRKSAQPPFTLSLSLSCLSCVSWLCAVCVCTVHLSAGLSSE